jgi:hypothetical protein
VPAKHRVRIANILIILRNIFAQPFRRVAASFCRAAA